MKNYLKEIICLLISAGVLYIFPAFLHLTDPIGVFVYMFICIFGVSLVLGIISDDIVKFAFPLGISVLYFPTIDIFYNHTASAFLGYFFVISLFGVALGGGIRWLYQKFKQKQ